MTLDQLRPARSRLPAKAGEDLRVQKCVRYQGQEPTLQDVAKVQKRRQQAQLHSKEGKLHAKGWSQNHARGEGTTAGKQGSNKPNKAAPQATKGKNAATRATGSVLVFKLTQKSLIGLWPIRLRVLYKNDRYRPMTIPTSKKSHRPVQNDSKG